MTSEAKELFIADRARALAAVILTRRHDLHVEETKRTTGLDLHVYIDREDKPMRLAFGVLLRGVASPMTPENANSVLGPTMAQFQGMRKFTYPVMNRCSFLGWRSPWSAAAVVPSSSTRSSRIASPSPTTCSTT
jgi:hypothetical protein